MVICSCLHRCVHFSDKPEQGMDFAGFLQLMQWPRSWRLHEAVAEALRELEDGRHKLWQHTLCRRADGEVSGLRDPSACTCKVRLAANRHRRRQLTGHQVKNYLVFKFSKFPARVRTIFCQEYQASENRYCAFSEPGCLSAWTFDLLLAFCSNVPIPVVRGRHEVKQHCLRPIPSP